MMHARAARATSLASLGLAVLMTTGCAGSEEPAEPAGPFPPRPVQLAVERVDPCAALTPDQLTRVRMDTGRPGTIDVDGASSPTCTWVNGGVIGYNLQTIPFGAERAVGPDSTIVQVNGFGALQTFVDDKPAPPLCMLTIDAADGQTIRVQAEARPTQSPPNDELCALATEFAQDAMTTVATTYRR